MLTMILYTVKEVIEGRGQEPYIAFKLQSLLESQNFRVNHYENKDVYLGKIFPLQNKLDRLFLIHFQIREIRST